MHDLKFAGEIISALKKAAEKHNIKKFSDIPFIVNARLSAFSHVKPEGLNETFLLIAEKEDFKNVRLVVTPKSFTIKCRKCGKDSSEYRPVFNCRFCGSSDFDMDMGEEFSVDSVEIGDSNSK